MKKIIMIGLMLFATTLSAQSLDKERPFAVYTITSPGAYDDGINIGFGIEYQMNLMYFGVQLFTFPDLNGETYLEFSGIPLGFNYASYNDQHRVYAGAKIGTIYRGGYPYPLIGFQSGYDFAFPNSNIYIGIMGEYNRRADFEFWEENVENYWRFSGFVKLGVKF